MALPEDFKKYLIFLINDYLQIYKEKLLSETGSGMQKKPHMTDYNIGLTIGFIEATINTAFTAGYFRSMNPEEQKESETLVQDMMEDFKQAWYEEYEGPCSIFDMN